MKRTQKARVHRALETSGRRGITAVDFMAPAVYDGGGPILRLPSRIAELKAEGVPITASGRRDKCVIYRLGHALPVPPPTVDPALLKRVVGAAPPRNAIFDEDDR